MSERGSVTAGRGIVASETEEREITVGGVVHIKAGERHWHGEGEFADVAYHGDDRWRDVETLRFTLHLRSPKQFTGAVSGQVAKIHEVKKALYSS